MHPNAAFRWEDEAGMRAFVAARGFATVCIAGPSAPLLAHAPVLVTQQGRLRFHLARSNRILAHLDGATAVANILGDDVYISPDWYGTPDQVPTWNYISVEIEGSVAALDETALVDQIETLSATFEAQLAPKPAWRREKMTAGRFESMLSAIRCFELTPKTWRGTRKLGQNKSPTERGALAKALEAAGHETVAGLISRL